MPAPQRCGTVAVGFGPLPACGCDDRSLRFKLAHYGADHRGGGGGGQAYPYFLAVCTCQQGCHDGVKQALRCPGLLLNGVRLLGKAARSLGPRERCPGMAASIPVGLGWVIQPKPGELAPFGTKNVFGWRRSTRPRPCWAHRWYMISYTTEPKSPPHVLMRLRSDTSEEPTIASGAAARLPTVDCQRAPSSDCTHT